MSYAPAGAHMRDIRPKAGPKLSLIAFASTAIAMALCLIMSERFFMINDDSFIQLFLAGKMTGGTPTGEVVFINSFLGDVLAVLFTAFPIGALVVCLPACGHFPCLLSGMPCPTRHLPPCLPQQRECRRTGKGGAHRCHNVPSLHRLLFSNSQDAVHDDPGRVLRVSHPLFPGLVF